MSKFKFVYQDWINKIPIVNGLSKEVINYIKEYNILNNLTTHNEYLRLSELDHKSPSEGFNFKHSNLLLYFKRHYGLENLTFCSEIIDDDSNYFFPIEVEGSNIESISNPYNFILNGVNLTTNFIDTFNESTLEFIKSGKLKILIGCLTEPSFSKDSIVKIEQYFQNNGIDSKNIYFLFGNKKLNHDANLNFSHASMQQQAEIAHRYPITASSLGYECDIVRPVDINSNNIRNKKFLCWNRALNRPHRVALLYLALKHNLLDEGIFSFIHSLSVNLEQDLRSLIDDTDQNINDFLNEVSNRVPIEVDTHHLPEGKKMGFQSNENNKKEYYASTYVHITSETQFDSESSPFFSEKTFRPIANLQPFVYVGNYNALEELKRLGFKTFHPYIDETYDQIKDPKIRFNLIQKEILKFANMPIDDVHKFYHSVEDILIHNQNVFMSYSNFNPLKDFFDSI